MLEKFSYKNEIGLERLGTPFTVHEESKSYIVISKLVKSVHHFLLNSSQCCGSIRISSIYVRSLSVQIHSVNYNRIFCYKYPLEHLHKQMLSVVFLNTVISFTTEVNLDGH